MSFLIKNIAPVDVEFALFSHPWKNAFMRLDGKDFQKPYGEGGGIANCQYVSDENIQQKNFGTHEKLRYYSLDNTTIAIESVQFPKCYLRLDGSQISANNPVGGTVNLQIHDTPPSADGGSWEVYKVHYLGDRGYMAMESVKWPGVYLRINGTGVTQPHPDGSGMLEAVWGPDHDGVKLEGIPL